MISLPKELVQAFLLAGLLVAVWEFEAVIVRRRRPGWSFPTLALGAPGGLLLVALWGGITVPFGVFAVALVAVWFLIPAGAWPWIGSVGVLVSATAQSLLEFGRSPRTVLGILLLAGLMAALRIATAVRSRYRYFPLWVYVAATVIVMTFMTVNRDPGRDSVISAGVGALLMAYIVGRTDRDQRSQHDLYRAEHDALTDAFTRHGFAAWSAQCPPGGLASGVVVACDVDDFKWFNDTWGHDLGDQVLQQVARRLRAELRSEDALVRPGGDEFVVWIPGASATTGDELAQRLHRALTERIYRLPTGPMHLGVSIGWAAGPLTHETARIADQRLLVAKRQGKDRVHREGRPEPPRPDRVARTIHDRLGWLVEVLAPLWSNWPMANVLTDLEGYIVAANPAYERVTGRGLGELVGQKPGINAGRATPPETYQELWGALVVSQPWHGYFENRRPDGTVWWAREWINPIRMGGRTVGYWGMAEEASAPGAAPGKNTTLPAFRALRWQLEETRLTVVFQPIVNLQTEEVLGYEALIRPIMADRVISPSEWFALALDQEREVEADIACLQAIKRTVTSLGKWPAGQKLFLNVRSQTLICGWNFDAYLNGLTEVMPWGQLVVEVSEQGIQTLSDWEDLAGRYPHVCFAQDDVGSGEADLARLVRFQPAWVKIDISLVSRIVDDFYARQLITALTSLAHGRGALVIGEGVETVEQALALRQCGADAAQGYLWAKEGPELAIITPRLAEDRTR